MDTVPIFETRQSYTTWMESRFGNIPEKTIELVASYVFFTSDGNITDQDEDSAYFIRRIQNGRMTSYEFCIYLSGDEENQKPLFERSISLEKRDEDCAAWDAFVAANIPEIVKV